MVITAPCSIHSKEIALDYAKRLVELQKELEDQIFIVMSTLKTSYNWRLERSYQ